MSKSTGKGSTIPTELGAENVYHQTSILGDSTRQAYQEAIAWLAKDHATEA